MAVFVYVLNFLLLWTVFFIVNQRDSFLANIRLAFVKAMVLMALFTVIVTESLSYFHALSFWPVLYVWLIVAGGLVIVAAVLFQRMPLKKLELKHIITRLKDFDKAYLMVADCFSFFIIVPLYFLALFYPPNNSDSLGYHLPRIEHWLQNCSVHHYLTNDVRQLYTPPLPEFLGLHLRVLCGSDIFLNMIQFFAMIGCLFLVSLWVRLLGFNYKYQFLSIVLTLAIPMGILQATTTQTDYVSAFFLSCVLFWGFLLAKSLSLNWTHVFWGALAMGLGFLIKPMIGIFAIVFVLGMAFVYLKKWRFRAVALGFVFLFFILLLNMPFWMRNYQRCENFLGDRGFVNLAQNERMNGIFFISNVLRNASTHLALPFANSALNKTVIFIHEKVLGISASERSITLCQELYEPFFCINEDSSGNFFVLLLLLFLMGYVLFKMKKIVASKKYFLIFYFLSLLGGYGLFSFMLKWQPWITRLDLPFFVIAVPFMVCVLHDIYIENDRAARYLRWFLGVILCYWMFSFVVKDVVIFLVLVVFSLVFYWMVFKKMLLDRGRWLLIFTAFLCTIPYVYFNTAKPLFGKTSLLFESRERKYFRKNEKAYKAHLKIAKIIEEFGICSVGILSSGCINEYLLWVVLKNRLSDAFTINHLNANKILSKEADVFNDPFFLKQCRNYSAIVAYVNGVEHLFERDRIALIESLGTQNEPLFLIILKNMKIREVGR